MDERRKADRSKSLLGARVVFHNRASTIDCTIRNISKAGGRLVFGAAVQVPDEFDLVIHQRGEAHRCRVAWRNASEVGVAFVDPPAGEASRSPEAERRIKALEAERAALKRRIMQLRGEG
jgi:hypothetical protein